ncbi:hypothetical protein ZWY2020_047616 [Hordeum vulgare]|nr:hypothetical protein ZWY2020_047616 [Hordeum vulgare]
MTIGHRRAIGCSGALEHGTTPPTSSMHLFLQHYLCEQTKIDPTVAPPRKKKTVLHLLLRLLPCRDAFHGVHRPAEARITCSAAANLEKPPRRRSRWRVDLRRRRQTPWRYRREEEESDEDEEGRRWSRDAAKRRAARLPRSHSTGHSLFAASATAAERSDHERFTLRPPHHVRERVLRSRHLRQATSLIDLAGASPEGSVRGGRPAGEASRSRAAAVAGVPGEDDVVGPRGRQSVQKGWDGSTRRGRDDPESSKKGAASPAVARP